jgi:hypothetical protein
MKRMKPKSYRRLMRSVDRRVHLLACAVLAACHSPCLRRGPRAPALLLACERDEGEGEEMLQEEREGEQMLQEEGPMPYAPMPMHMPHPVSKQTLSCLSLVCVCARARVCLCFYLCGGAGR